MHQKVQRVDVKNANEVVLAVILYSLVHYAVWFYHSVNWDTLVDASKMETDGPNGVFQAPHSRIYQKLKSVSQKSRAKQKKLKIKKYWIIADEWQWLEAIKMIWYFWKCKIGIITHQSGNF